MEYTRGEVEYKLMGLWRQMRNELDRMGLPDVLDKRNTQFDFIHWALSPHQSSIQFRYEHESDEEDEHALD